MRTECCQEKNIPWSISTKDQGENGYYMNAYGRWMFWSISRHDITILGVSAETASLFPV